eukprot:1056165-Rhodomonas_salina.3
MASRWGFANLNTPTLRQARNVKGHCWSTRNRGTASYYYYNRPICVTSSHSALRLTPSSALAQHSLYDWRRLIARTHLGAAACVGR